MIFWSNNKCDVPYRPNPSHGQTLIVLSMRPSIGHSVGNCCLGYGCMNRVHAPIGRIALIPLSGLADCFCCPQCQDMPYIALITDFTRQESSCGYAHITALSRRSSQKVGFVVIPVMGSR